MNRIYSAVFVTFCFTILGYKVLAGESPNDNSLHSLTYFNGAAYRERMEYLQKNPKILDNLRQLSASGDNERVQKEILSAWHLNREVFDDMLKGMSRYETIARSSVRAYEPNPSSFAQSWLSMHGGTLTLLAIEVVWKQVDWPEWRILAMMEILKQHADDNMLIPIVDRLEAEENEDVRTALLQLLGAKGGVKTLERLKALAKEKKDVAEKMLDCAKTIQERLGKKDQSDADSEPAESAKPKKTPAPTKEENRATNEPKE